MITFTFSLTNDNFHFLFLAQISGSAPPCVAGFPRIYYRHFYWFDHFQPIPIWLTMAIAIFTGFWQKKGRCWKKRDQDDDDGLVKQDDDDWNEGAWGKSEATYGATWRLTTCPIFSITVVIVIILFQIIIVQFSAFPQSPVSSLLLLWLELQSPPKIIMVKTKT